MGVAPVKGIGAESSRVAGSAGFGVDNGTGRAATTAFIDGLGDRHGDSVASESCTARTSSPWKADNSADKDVKDGNIEADVGVRTPTA